MGVKLELELELELGCKTLTVTEKYTLRVFENRVLRKVFGSIRVKVIREWSKVHNEELHDLYFPPNIIRAIKSRGMRLAGHVARVSADSFTYHLQLLEETIQRITRIRRFGKNTCCLSNINPSIRLLDIPTQNQAHNFSYGLSSFSFQQK